MTKNYYLFAPSFSLLQWAHTWEILLFDQSSWLKISTHPHVHCFTGSHYDSWRTIMRLSLSAQEKLATLPGSTSSTLFEQWCGFFYVPKDVDKWKRCEMGPTVRKCNRLQMSLQRQHFHLSYLNTLSVGLARVWTREPPLSRLALSQLS